MLYSPVPAGAVAAAGVLVAASRVITVVAAPAASAGAGMAAPLRTTHTHAQRSAYVRATSACKLDAGTDKTRANEEGKFWQRKTEE